MLKEKIIKLVVVVVLQTGLPTSGGGLAENHPGTLLGFGAARRHANMAEICKSLQEKQTFGENIRSDTLIMMTNFLGENH